MSGSIRAALAVCQLTIVPTRSYKAPLFQSSHSAGRGEP
jgi:hypothetical protein